MIFLNKRTLLKRKFHNINQGISAGYEENKADYKYYKIPKNINTKNQINMTSKTLFITAVIAGTLSTATSCSYFESGKNLEKGTPMESSKTAVQKILADKETNEGKRFSITGYLNYSAGMTVYVDRPQSVYVNTAPGDDGETITPIELKWAENGNNSVFVPEDAGRGSDKTIFYDNEGKPLTTNDKVEVSFEVDKASIYPVKIRVDKVK